MPNDPGPTDERNRADLLTSLDEAAAGQADPGGDPPHAYIPAGPVEAAPYLGYCPPEVRQEAFGAVLEGVETGAYDTQIVNWLTGWDDPDVPDHRIPDVALPPCGRGRGKKKATITEIMQRSGQEPETAARTMTAAASPDDLTRGGCRPPRCRYGPG